jgi:hypothetical protein
LTIDTAGRGVTTTPIPGAKTMIETPDEWLNELFEFNFCDVCGGDVEDHDVCLVPGIGTYFARCRRANGGDPTEDAPRTMPSETRAALERADTSGDCCRPDHRGE